MDAYEHRSHRRSPTWVHAVVEVDGELASRAGVVVDLSMGGAAVQMQSWSGKTSGKLGVIGRGERYLIPFVVTGTETVMQGVIVHAKFGDLDRRSREFLTELMAASMSEFEASQRYLAMRPNDLVG